MSVPTNGNIVMKPREWALLIVLSILWGGSFFFVEVALVDLPPLTLVLGRVGIAAAATAWFSAEIYVGTFTADPDVHRLGLSYFRITSLTFLFQLLLMVVGTGMRASGDFNTPMKVMKQSKKR